MNILSREELRNQLKKGEINPLYLLFGAEKYLRDLSALMVGLKQLLQTNVLVCAIRFPRKTLFPFVKRIRFPPGFRIGLPESPEKAEPFARALTSIWVVLKPSLFLVC